MWRLGSVSSATARWDGPTATGTRSPRVCAPTSPATARHHQWPPSRRRTPSRRGIRHRARQRRLAGRDLSGRCRHRPCVHPARDTCRDRCGGRPGRQGDRLREAACGRLCRCESGPRRGHRSGCFAPDRVQLPPASALSLMKRMVDEGRIGEVRLWRGTWLSDEFLDPISPSTGVSPSARAGAQSPIWERISSISPAGWPARSSPSPPIHGPSPTGGLMRMAVRAMPSTSTMHRALCCALPTVASGSSRLRRSRPAVPVIFTVEVNRSRGTLRFDHVRLTNSGTPTRRTRLSSTGRAGPEQNTRPDPETQGWWPIGQGTGYGASSSTRRRTSWPTCPPLEPGPRCRLRRAGCVRGDRVSRR